MKSKIFRMTALALLVTMVLTMTAFAITPRAARLTCPRCGSTTGSSYGIGDGYHTTTCWCGTVYQQYHNFVNGVCTKCKGIVGECR